jgi:SAM-dependent methyltransferase
VTIATEKPLTCPVCEGLPTDEPFYSASDWLVACCSRCTFAWVVDIREAPTSTAFDWGAEVVDESRERRHMYLDRVKRVERFDPAPRRWLDVGCGGGGLLLCAVDSGFVAEAIELSPSAELIEARHNIPVHRRPLPEVWKELRFPNYGVVSYFHVLEHVVDLKAELAAAANVLSAEGVLVVEVPYFGSFLWRILRSRHRHFYRAHRSYFNPGSLRELLTRCGFTVLSTESVPYEMTFDWFLMRLGKLTNWMRKVFPVALLKRPIRINSGEYLLVIARRATP